MDIEELVRQTDQKLLTKVIGKSLERNT